MVILRFDVDCHKDVQGVCEWPRVKIDLKRDFCTSHWAYESNCRLNVDDSFGVKVLAKTSVLP